MTEYWLISAPGDKTCQQTWETMNNLTSKQNTLSSNYKFHIPDLKVGTLDQLVGLSDDLGKLDAFVEQVTRKVAAYLGEVLEDQRDKLHENLMANNSQTSVDGENSSPEGGPDTPPNTPVTPSSSSSHKYNTREPHHHQQNQQHRPWKDSEKYDQEPAPSLGQHHHHHHERHQNLCLSHSSHCQNYDSTNYNHNHHDSTADLKKIVISSSNQGACDTIRTHNESINTYYHTQWCITASAPSSPSPIPTPTTPSRSLSSELSSDEELGRLRRSQQRIKIKLQRTTSSSTKSIQDDNDTSHDDEDIDETEEQDEDDFGILPNPGTHPTKEPREKMI